MNFTHIRLVVTGELGDGKFQATVGTGTRTGSVTQIGNGINMVGGSVGFENGRFIIGGIGNITANNVSNSFNGGISVSPRVRIHVAGNVGMDVTTSTGDITVEGSVTGNVKTNTGDIQVNGAHGVSGYAHTNTGDVKIKGNVGGQVKTNMGDIKIKGAAPNYSGKKK